LKENRRRIPISLHLKRELALTLKLLALQQDHNARQSAVMTKQARGEKKQEKLRNRCHSQTVSVHSHLLEFDTGLFEAV